MTPCDLCALDCGNHPFELVTAEKTLKFCCEGCRGIYQMLHDIKEIAPQQDQNTQPTTERSRT